MLLVAFTITSSLVSPTAAFADSKLDEPFKKLFTGIASWYGGKFHGRRTASGTTYNMHGMTCAHKTLPFGTKLIVENQTNGKTCQVTVTDRRPYHGRRVIDLSKALQISWEWTASAMSFATSERWSPRALAEQLKALVEQPKKQAKQLQICLAILEKWPRKFMKRLRKSNPEDCQLLRDL